MRRWFIPLLVLSGLALAGPATAQGVLHDCDITQRDARVDWITPKYAFVVKGGAVTVIDSVILDFAGVPVSAQVRQRGDVMVLHWTVVVTDALKNQARMSYRAELDTGARSVNVRVSPVGYPQSWRGSGTCRTRSE